MGRKVEQILFFLTGGRQPGAAAPGRWKGRDVTVLDTYEQERKAHAAAMILMAVSVGAVSSYTFDDVTVENVYTTNMAEFLKHSSYRNSIYTKQ